MRTPESIQWYKTLESSVKPVGFKNSALNEAGELCIGMTHNQSVGYYACTYTELNGVRNFGGSRRWNLKGESEDGHSNLLLDTVQQGVHTI